MISAVVLTKNEEENIRECINSLKWCDEVIVLDDNSSDKTVEISQKEGTIVVKRSLNADFAGQRNFGLSKASFEWILFVDADERVSERLSHEIKNKISKGSFDAFRVRRIDKIWGKELKYGETGDIKLIRLAKKNSGHWDGKVHEEWLVDGEVGTLDNPLYHFPHKSVDDFLKKINLYTDIRAQELFEKKAKSGFLDIVLYTKGKFVINYFFKLGLLDGIPGLVHAILMSFHAFLVRGKLWLLWKRK